MLVVAQVRLAGNGGRVMGRSPRAVSIVLATIPLTAGHPDGEVVFDVVFVVVLASLLVQATTVGLLVKRFGFTDETV